MDFIEKKALTKMKNFIGDIEVKNIVDLFTNSKSGVFVVAGCFVSVVEGVDMWYPRVATSSSPRYDYLFFLFISLYNYLPQVFLKKSF
jgi:hypothetical protein